MKHKEGCEARMFAFPPAIQPVCRWDHEKSANRKDGIEDQSQKNKWDNLHRRQSNNCQNREWLTNKM